ncbi:MAG: ACP S-malonyltransferase [Cyanobacteria bacterium]|nr:ACP S-malonyltransferase [Cyanobacteriota bacterium]MDA1021252.1 ACP S-malonyltransferase [Cyanobacteriota bacterium]
MTKYSIIFPGQGAQSVGMGQDSHQASAQIQEIYAKADELFGSSPSISEVSFNGPEETLAKTLYTQPAILTLSIALASQVKAAIQASKIAKPEFVAGHSLGEFSALYMADVLSLEDVLRLVIKRAQLMEAAPAGAMSAIIGMDESKLNEIIAGINGASVANYNSADQIVATGTQEAMTELAKQVEEFATANSVKARVIALNVGGAFHSPLMQAASNEFANLIDACEFKDASIPVIQNINAQATTEANQIKTNLKQQMTGSVQWTKTCADLISKNGEIWEIGPGKVLAGLVKKQDRRYPVKNIASITDLDSVLNPVVN